MTGRSVPEWRGKTPDAKVPPRVRLRIFQRENGVCYLSGRKITVGDKWELEHRIPLSMGGEHREANLFPALFDQHKAKTRQEAAERAKADAVAKYHLGIRKPPSMRSRGFPVTEGKPSASRSPSKALPKRSLYEDAR